MRTKLGHVVGRSAVACLLSLAAASIAHATPSTTYWAPSTASCQGWGVPHVTYDTYFGKGPVAGTAGAPGYPIDTGLTVGFLPTQKIQGEIGFDLLLPSDHPFFLNAKLCTPESSMFRGSPAISFGIYNAGFEKDVTDYNVVHLMLQKSFPKGGYVSIGAYRGLNEKLLPNADGDESPSGFMAGFLSPDVQIGRKGLRKVNFAADVQTGDNALAAWGAGANVYFADNVSLLIGPVFFLEERLQPGGEDMLWTVQLDIDIPLGRSE